MKIVVLDGYTENPGDLTWTKLEELGELEVYDRTPLNDESEIINRIGNAEIAVSNKTPITRKVIESCPNLKLITVLATGYNVIDCVAAKERNIAVCNVPTYGTQAVAQYTIALLLEICHHIGEHNRSVHSGDWQKSPDFCYWNYPLIELAGKTIGIIGLGKIGCATAKIAKALGMKVLGYARKQTEEGLSVAEYVDLDTLLRSSDIISLHCPAAESTIGMINAESIAKMKKGIIIINTSRGQLIVEEDLKEALLSGYVQAAAVDVVSSEPIKENNPLLAAPNCIITPHIAWASKECRERILATTIENIKAYISGSPINVVN